MIDASFRNAEIAKRQSYDDLPLAKFYER